MAPDPHDRIVCPDSTTFIPAVERGTAFDAIHVASAGLNACDFLLGDDFKIGRKTEQTLRSLPLFDMVENR